MEAACRPLPDTSSVHCGYGAAGKQGFSAAVKLRQQNDPAISGYVSGLLSGLDGLHHDNDNLILRPAGRGDESHAAALVVNYRADRFVNSRRPVLFWNWAAGRSIHNDDLHSSETKQTAAPDRLFDL